MRTANKKYYRIRGYCVIDNDDCKQPDCRICRKAHYENDREEVKKQ